MINAIAESARIILNGAKGEKDQLESLLLVCKMAQRVEKSKLGTIREFFLLVFLEDLSGDNKKREHFGVPLNDYLIEK